MAAAHNGSGAILGSKRLKAIAVARGKKPVQLANSAKLLEIANTLYGEVKGFTGTWGCSPQSTLWERQPSNQELHNEPVEHF